MNEIVLQHGTAAVTRNVNGVVLFADFAEAKQEPNPQMSCWYGRTIYDWYTGIKPTLESSIVKHRNEWRAALKLPPV